MAEATLREINIVHVFCYLAGKYGMTLEKVRFVLMCLAVFVANSTFRGMVRHYQIRGQYWSVFLYYLAFLMTLPLIYVCTGFRYGLAVVFVLNGLYLFYIRKKRRRAALVLLFSVLIHFAVFPLILLIIIAQQLGGCRIFRNFPGFAGLILFMMIAIFGLQIAGEFLSLFTSVPFITRIYEIYIDAGAYYRNDYFKVITRNSLIFYYLYGFGVFLWLPVYLKGLRQSKPNGIFTAVFVLFICCVAVIANLTLLQRLNILLYPLLVTALFIQDAQTRFKPWRIFYILIVAFYVFALTNGRVQKVRRAGEEVRMLYTSAFSTFCFHYDEKWVEEHIYNRDLL